MLQQLTLARPGIGAWRAYAVLALGIVCLTTGTFFVKWAAVPGPASGFYRLLTASVVLLPWWLLQRAPRPTRRATIIALAAGSFFAIDVMLWNSAALLTSAANATLFGNATPIWVALGALLLFRERLPTLFWPGVLAALLGSLIITSGGNWGQFGMGWGDLLALAAGLFYAGYLLAIQQARTQLDTLSGLTLTVLAGVVITFGFCLATGTPLTGYSAASWASLIALGLISQVGGALAINYALGHIRATVVSVAMLAMPVLTALLAVPLLGEPLGVAQASGGALVLLGIYLVNRK
jgi:drug/metabolite transporter (DMT)-like permease